MKFSELVDISELRELCESFSSITGVVTAILDLEGNILTTSGWQNICTRFHRVHPGTACRCRESDTVLAGRLAKGERYNIYKCQNGLIDIAVPIIIEGEHVANFFTGQFLFEPPDEEYFIRQAEEFGFDKESYIEALNRVPIFSEDKVRSVMEFFTRLAQMIGGMGLAEKKLKEVNAELRKHQEHLEEQVRDRTSELLGTNRALQAEIAERKQAEAALRESEQRFRTLAAATFEGIAIIESGRFLDVNEQFAQLSGYELSELIHMKLADLLPPEELDRVLVNIYSGRESYLEHEMLCKDGSRRIVEAHGKPVDQKDQSGRNLRISAVRDITERKRAEAEIKQLNTDLASRAAELEAANTELEAFNHTVAHDLRQPLNLISMCCQSIKLLSGDQLNDECMGYVQNAYKATLRMDRLISALLNFSRMGRVEPRRETVDLGMAAHEVSRSLQLTEPERQVDFRIADGIMANCDANLLLTVLDNLLGNAWKYSRMREKAVIEFGVSDIGGVPTYFVRDNGEGFDKGDADKLFTPFKRLPGAEKSKGFGIGLATVERIIQKHGGKVWAESELDKGATFYFTLSAD
jgi:PAS domain S-box-containing protein